MLHFNLVIEKKTEAARVCSSPRSLSHTHTCSAVEEISETPSAFCRRRKHASTTSNSHDFQPCLSGMYTTRKAAEPDKTKTMISCSVLILVLLVGDCLASKHAGPPYDPTSSPRSNGTNSTHISEFTDPATGLNPFLDLEEGGTGEMGRNIMEEEALPPPHLPDFGLQLIEGDPTDRGSSRWDQGFDRRWGNFNNKYMSPMLPTTDMSPDEWQNENRRYRQFGKATESDMKTVPSDFVPAPRNSDDNDYYSLQPAEDNVLDVDYNTESHKDEAETAEDNTAHPKKVPISENVLISAAITGAAVAVIALLLAVCWWRQKMKRVSTQGNSNTTENDIESVISDKTNTNGDVQRKSVSA